MNKDILNTLVNDSCSHCKLSKGYYIIIALFIINSNSSYL